MLVVPFRVQNSGLGTCPLGVFSLSRSFCGTFFKLIEIYDTLLKPLRECIQTIVLVTVFLTAR